MAKLLARLLGPVVDLSQSDAVVSVQLGGGPPSQLDESREEDNLEESSGRDLEESSDTTVNVGELEALGGADVAVERPLVVVDEGSEHGNHGNAAVLALDGAVTLELFLRGDVSEGVEESERSGGSNLGGLGQKSGRDLLQDTNGPERETCAYVRRDGNEGVSVKSNHSKCNTTIVSIFVIQRRAGVYRYV